MLIRDELQIKVTPHQHGAAVRFPKDRFLISDFKARFSRARWGGGTKSWHIPGKLAGHRAQLWADQQQPYLRGLEQAARDAEWDDPAPAIISKGNASAPVERPLPADADPFGLPWADWYNLSGENRIRGARWPKYICELHRDLHELDHAPGFALRLPSTGEMVRLMAQFDPVRLPTHPLWRGGPMAHWMYERQHWFFVRLPYWRPLRSALPEIKSRVQDRMRRYGC